MFEKFLQIDQKLSARLGVAEKAGWPRRLAIVLAHSGDSWFWLLAFGLVWWFGTPYWQWRAIFLAISTLLTAISVLLVKFTVRRRRPEGQWGGIYRKTDPHSFPSGHAARAVMLAVAALGIGPLWFGLLLACWAPLVVLARVLMGVHYLSDVIAGAVFGAALGLVWLALIPRLLPSLV